MDGALFPLWLVADDISEKLRTPLELRLPWKNVQRGSLGSFQSAPFQSKAILRMSPDLGLMSCFDPADRWTMSRSDGTSAAQIAVLRPTDGILVVEQRERRKTCFPREAIVIDPNRETTFITTEVSRLDCFVVSGLQGQRDNILEDGIARIRHDNGALIVLGHYAAALMRGLLPMNSESLTALATDYMRSLVLAMIDDAKLSTSSYTRRSSRTPLSLVAIKADIEVRLAQRDLSLRDLAASHGVAVRVLQKLFEAEGRTFSEYLLERRLERARQLLHNATLDTKSVSSIAFDVGFGDLSYFNRTFKKRFGATPRDVRSRIDALRKAIRIDR